MTRLRVAIRCTVRRSTSISSPSWARRSGPPSRSATQATKSCACWSVDRRELKALDDPEGLVVRAEVVALEAKKEAAVRNGKRRRAAIAFGGARDRIQRR